MDLVAEGRTRDLIQERARLPSRAAGEHQIRTGSPRPPEPFTCGHEPAEVLARLERAKVEDVRASARVPLPNPSPPLLIDARAVPRVDTVGGDSDATPRLGKLRDELPRGRLRDGEKPGGAVDRLLDPWHEADDRLAAVPLRVGKRGEVVHDRDGRHRAA